MRSGRSWLRSFRRPVEGLVLRLSAEDGHPLVALRAPSAADLERWHTLLTQLILAKPNVAIHLTGWIQREGAGDFHAAPFPT